MKQGRGVHTQQFFSTAPVALAKAAEQREIKQNSHRQEKKKWRYLADGVLYLLLHKEVPSPCAKPTTRPAGVGVAQVGLPTGHTSHIDATCPEMSQQSPPPSSSLFPELEEHKRLCIEDRGEENRKEVKTNRTFLSFPHGPRLLSMR